MKKLTEMENAALRHVQDELRYQRSKQAQIDRTIDKVKRAKIDHAVGHLSECGILKCHPDCHHPK